MLQTLTPILKSFRARQPQLDGPRVHRRDACGLCQSTEAALLSKADYWDLMELDVVRCASCGLIQVDPMLTPEAASTGCLALYRHQQAGETSRSRRRGLFRAFRRGVAFGVSLKLKGIKPQRVLEVGAGDAYFLKGLQYIFPEAQYTCLDIVAEILEAMKNQHRFETIHASLEDMNPKSVGPFDLVIARDILEHVGRPGDVLKNLVDVLSPNGYLFFITPNGWQDAWQMFSRWQADHVRSELLINHVNYFDAVSLRARLEDLGLKVHQWFIYDFKTFSRGAGWRLIEKHKSRRSEKRSAERAIRETKSLDSTFEDAVANPIPRAFNSRLLRWPLMFYCWFKHTAFIRANANTRVGEEIYCLAQKVPVDFPPHGESKLG